MHALFDLTRDPFVANAARWLLILAIQSSVFLAAVLLIERLVAKHVHPADRHRQLLISLFAVPLLPYAGRLLAPMKLALFNPTLPVISHAEPVSLARVVDTASPLNVQFATTPRLVHLTPSTFPQAGIVWSEWLPLLALLIYSAGALFLAARLLFGMARVQVLVHRSRPLRDDEWARFESTVSIPTQVRILVSDELPSPILAGWIRPAILLPAALLHRGSVHEIQFAIEHELAHFRRHDTRSKLLAALLKVVLWPQPLVWMVVRRISLLAEQACDAEVTRHHTSPLPYAEFLTRAGSHPSYAGASAALSHNSSQLLPRIQQLLNTRRPIMSTKRTLLLLSSVAAVLVLSSALVATPIVDSSHASRLPAVSAEPVRHAFPDAPEAPEVVEAQPVEEAFPAEPAPEVEPVEPEPPSWIVALESMQADSFGTDSVNVYYTNDGRVIRVLKATGDQTILISGEQAETVYSGDTDEIGDLLIAVGDSSDGRLIRAYVNGDTVLTGEALRLVVRDGRGDRSLERIRVRPDREGRMYFIDEDGDTLLYRVREARHVVRNAAK